MPRPGTLRRQTKRFAKQAKVLFRESVSWTTIVIPPLRGTKVSQNTTAGVSSFRRSVVGRRVPFFLGPKAFAWHPKSLEGGQ